MRLPPPTTDPELDARVGYPLELAGDAKNLVKGEARLLTTRAKRLAAQFEDDSAIFWVRDSVGHWRFSRGGLGSKVILGPRDGRR